MNILAVDDDPASLEVLCDTLESAGYHTLAARNGEEALAILRTGTTRIVISDWKMPAMSGIELCEAVRSKRASQYTYFILLTGNGLPNHIINGLGAGADDFMTKPYAPRELLLRVQAGERVIALETRDLMIFAMAKLAESRDKDTGFHLERVRLYAQALAERAAMHPRFCHAVDEEFVKLIYLTSPLHDIGKVAIPDAILLKPGSLNTAEWEMMKTHTERGVETLEMAMREYPDAHFLSMARDIAAAHHERYDGTGYPNGLEGNEIPMAAQIVCLADTYDAITSKRVYKCAYSHERAHQIILEEAGKQFSPNLVQLYLSVEKQFLAFHKQYHE